MDLVTAALVILGALGILRTRRRGSAPRPGPAVAVGDSIVAHGGMVAVLNTLEGYTWRNHGVVGNSTRQMLARSPEWARRGTTEVLIMGNLNDLSHRHDASWTIYNLRRLYSIARGLGARVVAVTSTPWRRYAVWTPEAQAKQDLINRWILSGADGLADAVVDAYSPLVDPATPAALDPRWAAPDGLHLNRDGQRELGEVIVGAAYQGLPRRSS